ncbi:hypothetical protein B0A52_01351 [Exophiala mesophila]|uniref:Uncharacterized protein n=1 Tax=Exophiala mesophila TaxID=212818 RepID=A0A438NH66_EXOME|nr:hypothetical protein B0A52_01351 [Exophiala mesophila]
MCRLLAQSAIEGKADVNPTVQMIRAPWTKEFSDAHRAEFEQYKVDAKEPVLRIFRQANWSRLCLLHAQEQPMSEWLRNKEFLVSDEFYQRIRPALVLATRFIENSRDFYDSIWAGIQRDNGDILEEDSHHNNPFINMWNESVLDQMSNFQIYLGHHPNFDAYNSSAHIHWGVYPTTQVERISTIALHIGQNFTTFFQHPEYQEWPQQKKNRILFLLAATLTHEVAHVCWRFRCMSIARRSKNYNDSADEPYRHKDDPERELGFAWEDWALGGLVTTLHRDPSTDDHGEQDTPYTLAEEVGLTRWRDYVNKTRDSSLFLPISPDLLDAMFDSKVWEVAFKSNIKPVKPDFLAIIWQTKWRMEYKKANFGAECPQIPAFKRQWVDRRARAREIEQRLAIPQFAPTRQPNFEAQWLQLGRQARAQNPRRNYVNDKQTGIPPRRLYQAIPQRVMSPVTPIQPWSQSTQNQPGSSNAPPNYEQQWLALGRQAQQTNPRSNYTVRPIPHAQPSYEQQWLALGRQARQTNPRPNHRFDPRGQH